MFFTSYYHSLVRSKRAGVAVRKSGTVLHCTRHEMKGITKLSVYGIVHGQWLGSIVVRDECELSKQNLGANLTLGIQNIGKRTLNCSNL